MKTTTPSAREEKVEICRCKICRCERRRCQECGCQRRYKKGEMCRVYPSKSASSSAHGNTKTIKAMPELWEYPKHVEKTNILIPQSSRIIKVPRAQKKGFSQTCELLMPLNRALNAPRCHVSILRCAEVKSIHGDNQFTHLVLVVPADPGAG